MIVGVGNGRACDFAQRARGCGLLQQLNSTSARAEHLLFRDAALPQGGNLKSLQREHGRDRVCDELLGQTYYSSERQTHRRARQHCARHGLAAMSLDNQSNQCGKVRDSGPAPEAAFQWPSTERPHRRDRGAKKDCCGRTVPPTPESASTGTGVAGGGSLSRWIAIHCCATSTRNRPSRRVRTARRRLRPSFCKLPSRRESFVRHSPRRQRLPQNPCR